MDNQSVSLTFPNVIFSAAPQMKNLHCIRVEAELSHGNLGELSLLDESFSTPYLQVTFALLPNILPVVRLCFLLLVSIHSSAL